MSRRRSLAGALIGAVATACGRDAGIGALATGHWLPPAKIELWLGGLAPALEHHIRTQALPSLRAKFPTIVVTVAGVTPPNSRSLSRGTYGSGSSGQSATGINPSVMGSTGGRLTMSSSLSLRSLTADGDAFNRLLVDAASGLGSDVVPAGTGNHLVIAHYKLALPVVDRPLRTALQADFVSAAVAQTTFRGSIIGVPFMANPRAYVWRPDQFPASYSGSLPATWEQAVAVGVRPSQIRSRSMQRRPMFVNGLHLEFFEHLARAGVAPVEFGKTAFAGEEGVEVARFFQDRGATDATTRYGNSSTWGSDLGGTGVPGAWTTLAGILRVRHTAPARFDALRVGPRLEAEATSLKPDGTTTTPPKALATHAWWFASSKTAFPDHAWELIKELTSPENILAIAQRTWQVPVRHSVLTRGLYTDPIVRAFVSQYVMSGQPAPSLANAPEMENLLINRLNAISRGELEPRAALIDCARLWDNLIERSGISAD